MPGAHCAAGSPVTGSSQHEVPVRSGGPACPSAQGPHLLGLPSSFLPQMCFCERACVPTRCCCPNQHIGLKHESI